MINSLTVLKGLSEHIHFPVLNTGPHMLISMVLNTLVQTFQEFKCQQMYYEKVTVINIYKRP